MADPVFVSAGLVSQMTRSRQFKPVLLLVQQQQTFDLRQDVPESRCQFCRRFGEFLKRHIQRNLFVRRIRKGFDLLDTLRRSEEHTSELQSQSNLVCRLLLEKKKTTTRCRQRDVRTTSTPSSTTIPAGTASRCMHMPARRDCWTSFAMPATRAGARPRAPTPD